MTRLMLIFALAFLYHLAWDGDAQLYNVYRMDETGTMLAGPAVTLPVWLEGDATEQRLYTYWVTSIGIGGESDPCDPLGVWTGLRGDVTRDGIVDVADVRQLAHHLAGDNAACNRQGDLNDDFQFTAVDLVAALQEAQ